jgi:hypothetical protein
MTMPPRLTKKTELAEWMWLELEGMRSEEDRDFEEARLRRDALAEDEPARTSATHHRLLYLRRKSE